MIDIQNDHRFSFVFFSIYIILQSTGDRFLGKNLHVLFPLFAFSLSRIYKLIKNHRLENRAGYFIYNDSSVSTSVLGNIILLILINSLIVQNKIGKV